MDFTASGDRAAEIPSPRRTALAEWPVRWLLLAGGLLTALAGCHSEPDVTTYTVPKRPIEPPAASAPESEAPAGSLGPFAGGPFAGGPFAGRSPAGEAKTLAPGDPRPDRMLGAILLRPGKGWFFKMQGPREAVAARADDFHSLVESVHFDDDEPRWTLPAGWRQNPGDQFRYATLRSEGADGTKPMEITISTLGFDGNVDDYLLANINRWRGQLRLPKISRQEIADSVTSLLTKGGVARLVDLEGQLAAPGMSGPGSALGAGPMAGAAPGGAGGPAPSPHSRDAQSRGAHFTAPLAQGRMLGAIVMRPGAAWFFKLVGPKDAVSRREAEFNALVASLRFADDSPPEWTLPAGWRQEPPSGMRFATLLLDDKPETDRPAPSTVADRPLEVSVVKLLVGEGDALEYVLKNVNVWRDQLQARRLSKEELAGASRRVALDGAEAVVVNIEGLLTDGAGISSGLNSRDARPLGAALGETNPSGAGPSAAPGGEDGQ